MAALLDGPPMPARDLIKLLRLMRVTYYTPPMTDAERHGWYRFWIDALERIPEPFASEAFRDWTGNETRCPTPGDIANRARKLMGEARERLRQDGYL